MHDIRQQWAHIPMGMRTLLIIGILSGLWWGASSRWLDDMPAVVPLGDGDAAYYTGWHEAEPLSAAFSWQVGRWSDAQSTVHIPTLTHTWHVVELLITNQYMDGQQIRPEFTWRTTPAVGFTLQSGEIRRIALLLDTHPWWRWDIPVHVATSTQKIGDDPRQLGIMLLETTQSPTTIGGGASPYLVLQFAIMASVLIAMAHVMHRSGIRVWGAIGGVTFVYGVFVLTHALALWPYLHWWSVWLLVQLGCMLVLRAFGWLNATGTMAGDVLPLYVALQWWSLPIIQWMVLREGHPLPVRELLDLTPAMIGLGVAWGVGAAVVRWWPADGARPWLEHLRRWYFLGVLAGINAWQFIVAVPRFFRYGSGDFQIWVDAARNWVTTGVLYRLENVVANPFALYKRPPFYIMWFTPFVEWNTTQILDAYRWINMGLLGLTLVMWLSLVWRQHQRWWWVLVVITSVNAQPIFDTIGLGQTDIVLLFIFTLVYWCAQRRWDWVAGVVIAMVASFKIYPIILVVFFVIKRRWGVLWGTIAGLVLWNSIAIAVMGWDVHVLYATKVFFSIGGTTSWVENQTIAGFIARFYDDIFAMQLFSVPAVARVASLLSMALSAGAVILALRDYLEHDAEFGLQYGMFLILMVIAIPVAWMHYATILWLVCMLLFDYFRQRRVTLLPAWITALSMAVIMFGNQRSFNYKYDLGLVTLLLSSYKFYAMVLLTSIVVWAIWRGEVSWARQWRLDVVRVLQRYGMPVEWLRPR